MVTKQQHAAFQALTALAPSGQHAEHHERAVMAMLEAAPPEKRGSLQSIIDKAREQAAKLGKSIDWSKVFSAFMVAAMGGFSAEAIAAAVSLLLGGIIPIPAPTPPTPAPAVQAHAHAPAPTQEAAPQHAEAQHGDDV